MCIYIYIYCYGYDYHYDPEHVEVGDLRGVQQGHPDIKIHTVEKIHFVKKEKHVFYSAHVYSAHIPGRPISGLRVLRKSVKYEGTPMIIQVVIIMIIIIIVIIA